jgi:hypothetical protein
VYHGTHIMTQDPSIKKTLRAEGLDFFLASLAPIFIIGMIGSLVFFLISIGYSGAFQSRLLWNLGLYTAAAVLVARIAIEQSRPRAIAYLVALAASTLLMTPNVFAIQGPLSFLSFPMLIVLLTLIAFLADRITFDCALMSERTQSSGVGLLQSLGVVRSQRDSSQPGSASTATTHTHSAAKSIASTAKRRHNPGVWVLYFALMALPVFGFGQMFLRDPNDRRWGFIYLFAYLACSFCLLVMIALLSLRKYLRERGVPMETTFAMRWLAIGFTSVCVVLGILFWLPIPSQSFLSWELPFQIADRDDLRAHEWGWGEQGVQGDQAQPGEAANPKPNRQPQGPQANAVADPGLDPAARNANQDAGDGQPGSNPNASGSNADPKSAKPPTDSSPSRAASSGEPSSRKPESGSASTRGESSEQPKSSDTSSRPSSANASTQDPPSSSDAQPSEAAARPNSSSERPQRPDGDRRPEQHPQAENVGGRDQKKLQPDQAQPDQAQPAARNQEQMPAPERPAEGREAGEPNPGRWPEWNWNISASLRWLLLLALLLMVLVFGFLYRKELAAACAEFWRWWQGLLGRAPSRKATPIEDDVPAWIEDPYPPFRTFANPFVAGQNWTREQIVRHLYRACLSWGFEHRIVRRDDETPEEFMRRLAKRYPQQRDSITLLGNLYNRIAYARGKVAPDEIPALQNLWHWFLQSPAPESKAHTTS